MTPEALTQLINRRETRSPRSTLAITLASFVALACLYTVVEVILQVSQQRPLIMTVGSAVQRVPELMSAPAAVIVGAIIAVLGLLVIITAVSPGRRARHCLEHPRSVVVDNAVIASALARHAARAGNVGADNVRVSVSHREAEVRITPTSGSSVDHVAVAQAVQDQVLLYRLLPPVQPRVLVELAGRVGS